MYWIPVITIFSITPHLQLNMCGFIYIKIPTCKQMTVEQYENYVHDYYKYTILFNKWQYCRIIASEMYSLISFRILVFWETI